MDQEPLTNDERCWLRSLPNLEYLIWLNAVSQARSSSAESLELEIGRSRYAANKSELADFFAISLETVDLWARKGMPFSKNGTANVYDLRLAAKWLASQRAIKPADDAADDYRAEKSLAAKIQRQQLEGKLVDAERYEARLVMAIQAIRRGVESMHRAFGEAAADMLTSICDNAQRLLAESESEQEDDQS